MENISSRSMLSNHNPPVEKSKISRIEPISAFFANSNLSALYFYGMDAQGEEQLIRAWFYESKAMLREDLSYIRQNYPQIPVGKV